MHTPNSSTWIVQGSKSTLAISKEFELISLNMIPEYIFPILYHSGPKKLPKNS